mmetsp:Transcript_19399/g.34903  ORF Transcript_19399/g.34903 Transcript_19399/m.34903 type:complete len:100 (-) Transcript_19399:240-539(-)
MTAIVNARSKTMQRRNAMLPNSREAIALRTFRQSIRIRHHSSSSNSNPRTSGDNVVVGMSNNIEYDSDSSSNTEGRIVLQRVVRVSVREGRRTYVAPSA